MIYLEYKGDKLPYNTSYIAYKEFENITGIPYSKYDDTKPEHVEALFWGSLIAGHKVESKNMTVTFDECELILDTVYPQIISESVKVLREVAKKKSILRKWSGWMKRQPSQ